MTVRRVFGTSVRLSLVPLVLVIAWWVVSASRDSFFFPPLSQIVRTIRPTWGGAALTHDLVPSIERMVGGFAAAVLIGVALGFVLGRSPVLRALAEPALAYLRALPAPLLIPMLLLVFGIGTVTKDLVVILGSLWPVVATTADGVRSVDPVLVASTRVYNFGFRARTTVVLRAASPQIFAGARQALALAVILTVVSEMLMSSNGLGYLIARFQQSFAMPQMWSGVLLLGAVGFVLTKAFNAVEARALFWHAGSARRRQPS